MLDTKPSLYSGAGEVKARLHDLGLSDHFLRDAVLMGIQHSFACTAHDPRILPGILAWAKTIRHLRDWLVPLGWSTGNSRNYATVIDPKGQSAIAVAAGDANTGCSDVPPATRSDKGPATRDAIHENQLTFFDVGQSFPHPQSEPGKQTWLLLHHADYVAGEIRLELSLPENISSNGQVTKWHERIILEPIEFTSMDMSDKVEMTSEIEISIEPRKN